MTQDSINPATQFYRQNYDLVAKHVVVAGPKVFLGDLADRTCRYCGRTEPRVRFKQRAHAVPESLGNRTLFRNDECDDCNGLFGRGIENDFGYWSKPMRTLCRIRGKSGVPTIKNDNGRWRVESGPDGLAVSHDSYDEVFEIDEVRKEITFKLNRDPYTPVAVLKALVRMGLAILPQEEIGDFRAALAWVRETDHASSCLTNWPVARTFLPGSFGGDLISLMALRRTATISDLPYTFFVLIYGNEMFQVSLPAPEQEAHLHGRSLDMPFFPGPKLSPVAGVGPPVINLLDLTDSKVVHGDIVSCTMSYGERIAV